MNNRLLFNLFIGIVVVVVYFVATSALNLMASSGDVGERARSFERRTADAHVNSSDWKSAARYYKELIRSDPLNAGAHAYYAGCLRFQVERMLSAESVNNDELNSLIIQAKQAYTKCLAFKKNRNRARLFLAFLNAYEGNMDEAESLLTQAIKDRVPKDHFRKRCRLYRCTELLERREFAMYFY